MKKYVKPELFYEHFELNQHIASCAWELRIANEAVCVANANTDWLDSSFAGKAMFSGALPCTTTPEENDTTGGGGVCYQNGGGSDIGIAPLLIRS